VLQVLALAYTVNALSTMPAIACDSLGRPAITTVFSVASAGLNVALALLLVPSFGAMGAALALLVNSVVLVPWFLVYVHRRVLRVGLSRLIRQSLLRPAAATALIVLPALFLSRWVSGLGSLLLAIGATGLLYVLLATGIGTFDATERAIVSSWFRRRHVAERMGA
jgi:O-antigen/teichoic acid export membrane protein